MECGTPGAVLQRAFCKQFGRTHRASDWQFRQLHLALSVSSLSSGHRPSGTRLLIELAALTPHLGRARMRGQHLLHQSLQFGGSWHSHAFLLSSEVARYQVFRAVSRGPAGQHRGLGSANILCERAACVKTAARRRVGRAWRVSMKQYPPR